MNRLGNDNYERPKFTEQDYISSNRELFKEKLKDFIQVEPQFIEEIPCKTWIKYITSDGLYRSGGILIKNEYPNYLVLKNPYKKFTWCVDLTKNYIFMEDIKTKKEEKTEMENLYKLYKEGFVKLLETPE
jgi:hypothetical protein